MICDRKKRRAMVIETKKSAREAALERDAADALAQIAPGSMPGGCMDSGRPNAMGPPFSRKRRMSGRSICEGRSCHVTVFVQDAGFLLENL